MSIQAEYEKAFKNTFEEIKPELAQAFESNEKMLALFHKAFMGGWRGCALAIKNNVGGAK